MPDLTEPRAWVGFNRVAEKIPENACIDIRTEEQIKAHETRRRIEEIEERRRLKAEEDLWT